MRHVVAYMLAAMGGEGATPSEADIKSVLGSVGVEADDKQLKIVIDRFAGKSIDTLLAEGMFYFHHKK